MTNEVLHNHPITFTADEELVIERVGIDKVFKKKRIWKFRYHTWGGTHGYLGETPFIGTVEEAEKECHLRADRYQFQEEFISQVTLESQGVAESEIN